MYGNKMFDIVFGSYYVYIQIFCLVVQIVLFDFVVYVFVVSQYIGLIYCQ